MPVYLFDFSDNSHGWVASFADYDLDDAERYQFHSDFRARPASTGTGGSLFISSMNRSDDVFMYHKRRFVGLEPSSSYRGSFRVTFASQYMRGGGIGGDPAKSVYVKVCCAITEPQLVFSDGAYRLDIDIGKQSEPGRNSVLLGDIEKQRDGTKDYALVERSNTKPLSFTAAEDGSIWVLFGTDSGYEGETALYYIYFEADLAPVPVTSR